MAKITFFPALWLHRFMVFLHTLLDPNMWGSLHETHEQIFKTNQWKVSWYTLTSESSVLPPKVKKENHQTFLNCHREAWWGRPSALSASGKYTEETASFPLTICITYCHWDWKVPRREKNDLKFILLELRHKLPCLMGGWPWCKSDHKEEPWGFWGNISATA